MSEIIKKIQASMTGTRYANNDYNFPLISTKLEKDLNMEHGFLTQYHIGVRFGHTVRIDDSIPNQKEEALKIMRRAITELIFGEFRHSLTKAQYSLYDRNFEEAKRAIEEIEKKMFYDGE